MGRKQRDCRNEDKRTVCRQPPALGRRLFPALLQRSLAIDAGAYQGSSGGYNSPHNKNFFKRTIAHNSLLVYNPDEKFACWNYGGGGKTEFATNDGGQRMPGDRWETCRSFEQLLSKDYTTGKALAHGFGPDACKPDYFYCGKTPVSITEYPPNKKSCKIACWNTKESE